MSVYASIRIKCTVKEQYREEFNRCFELNNLYDSNIIEIQKVGAYRVSEFMFKNNKCFYPPIWDGCTDKGNEYETAWDKSTGRLVCAFSFNHAHTADIEYDITDMLNTIAENVETFEMYIENCTLDDLKIEDLDIYTNLKDKLIIQRS